MTETMLHRPVPHRLQGRTFLKAGLWAGQILTLTGCAAFPAMMASPPNLPESIGEAGSMTVATGQEPNGVTNLTSFQIPQASQPVDNASQGATDAQISSLVGEGSVNAALSPQTIPQFASTVFGGVLGLPFILSPDVATRTEIISGGSGGEISRRDLFRLTQLAMQQYGIGTYINGDIVTVGTSAPPGTDASIIRDRVARDVAGRVVQIFQVQTIEVNVLQSLIQDLFPNLANARITPDQLSNSMIISGSSRDVAQVVRALREIDQPRLAGAQVLRVEPIFWATDALASSLQQVMTTEGYVVSTSPSVSRALTILSFPAANQLLIFSQDEAVLQRARYWLETLDQPAGRGDSTSTFVYLVRNTDAQSLGQIAMGQAPSPSQAQPPVGVAGTQPVTTESGGSMVSATAGTAGASGTFLDGRLIIDPVGNRIIFTGTAADYAQLRSLLETLDVSAPQVVIEVMLAEVTLSDATRLGINFRGVEAANDGTLSFGTEGVAVGSGGVLATFVGPDFRARLNAEASNNRVNILQRPRLVVRSGGSARFQVGTDVPIITSQRATNTSQTGEGTDVLQSVQYRQTGVILDLETVVYGNRVDIKISQENSTAGAAPTGISSPTILNRSLTTQIQISDGQTGVLGGLISNNYTKENTGVPFLKDIPLIGSAFQNNSTTGERTELLVLITPYIVRGDEDMDSIVESYGRSMNAAFRTGRGWSYTLTPFSLGSRFPGVGIDLPRPDASEPSRATTLATPPVSQSGTAPQP